MQRQDSFIVENKTVDIYLAATAARPVIYLNTFSGEGAKVRKELESIGSPDLNLVAVSGLDWDHDMAPWDCPPLSKHDDPCTGGADDYLKVLTEMIIPEAEKYISGEPAWRGMAGYSLAGLFALYALYRTDRFSRAASVSGSLWFLGFKDYIFSHEMKIRPEHIYLSLGDTEYKTRNQFLRTVQENTEEIYEFYVSRGIDCVLKMNLGGHHVDAEKRTAAGIDWILRR